MTATIIPDHHAQAALAGYRAATARLDALIEGTHANAGLTAAQIHERASERMERLRAFLDALGRPQDAYPIVHVGGTSGKGSTSTLIATILQEAGYRTGLHTSPYLQTPSEKLQIDGRLIDAGEYADITNLVIDAAARWRDDGHEPISYGEAWMAISTLSFQRGKADVLVLEVGSGGRFDLTNIHDTILSVITSIGLDHTSRLGGTIPEIAWHKAGIIKPGRPAVTTVGDPSALEVIRAEAIGTGSALTIVDPATAIGAITTGRNGTSWTDSVSGRRWRMGMAGSFQASNGAAAIATARALRDLGWEIPDDAIERGLERARIPGRAEYVEDTSPVLLDGAHNPQKMAALASDLPVLLPVGNGGKRVAVIGALEAKQAGEIVSHLVPVADVLVTTSPHVFAKTSRDPESMAEVARAAGFDGPIWTEPEPEDAIDRALDIAGEHPGSAVLVTGSLFLVGNIRKRWYPEIEIVRARSSWPETGHRMSTTDTPIG